MDQDTLALHYWKVCDLWKRFCEEHNHLLELTLEEYSLLLNSDVDGIEEIVIDKKQTIERISKLEELRENIISQLNLDADPKKIESVSDLVEFLSDFEKELSEPHLQRFNLFLIDTIEKIQKQNKNNQLFINKTLQSLKSIREEAIGKKSYSTYNAKGSTKVSP